MGMNAGGKTVVRKLLRMTAGGSQTVDQNLLGMTAGGKTVVRKLLRITAAGEKIAPIKRSNRRHWLNENRDLQVQFSWGAHGEFMADFDHPTSVLRPHISQYKCEWCQEQVSDGRTIKCVSLPIYE